MEFRSPVLIKPDTRYQIKIYPQTQQKLSIRGHWETEMSSNSGIQISFYKNSDLNYDNSKIGWISAFNFNEI